MGCVNERAVMFKGIMYVYYIDRHVILCMYDMANVKCNVMYVNVNYV